MPAPRKLPPFHEALKIRTKRELRPGAYPCTECWGEGCERCSWSGYGSKLRAFRWYRSLQRRYDEAREQWNEQLEEVGKNIVGTDYYDLDMLRRIGERNK